MNTCEVYPIFAYLAFIYILTTLIYLCITHSYGTPFKDAVAKKPELQAIKDESVVKRSNAFYIGLVISIVIAVLFRPFGNCY
tara:strand:- start:364 stop:609 length:246 start_codon:yes stop_codon:yes gene_type:complete